MTSLLDLPSDSSSDFSLVELQIRDGNEAVMVLVFTADVTDVDVHYETDASARGYICCIGNDCPLCLIGSRASRQHLLPVYNVETRRVEILRVPPFFGPHTLISGLRSHLRANAQSSHILAITRDRQSYSIQSRPIVEGMDRGTRQIAAFMEAVKGGLDISSIVRRFSRSEIQSIPRIRTKLILLGHLSPDSHPNATGLVDDCDAPF